MGRGGTEQGDGGADRFYRGVAETERVGWSGVCGEGEVAFSPVEKPRLCLCHIAVARQPEQRCRATAGQSKAALCT
jgi:hypothetical protein